MSSLRLGAITLLVAASACDGSVPKYRGSHSLASPERTPRIAAGAMLEMTIKSQLERKRDNGSLVPQASSGPHYDTVEAQIVNADVTPAGIAEARPTPGSEGNLRLIGLIPGIASVTVVGEVAGQRTKLTFEIEIVEAAALTYSIAKDLDAQVAVHRGGESITLARRFCYEYSLEVFDKDSVSLNYFWPSTTMMSPVALRDFSCGTHGLLGSRIGHVKLPTLGRAEPVEVEFIDPKLDVVWSSTHTDGVDRRARYEPRVIATDAAGRRTALPFDLRERATTLTPNVCTTSKDGEGVYRLKGAVGECRIVVSVQSGHGNLPAIDVPSLLPDDDELPLEVGLFGEVAKLTFGMTVDDVTRVAPSLRNGNAERAHRQYALRYHHGRLSEITISAPYHAPTEIESRWKGFKGIHEKQVYSADSRIHATLTENGVGYSLTFRPAMSYEALLGTDPSGTAPAELPVLGQPCRAIRASIDAAALPHEDVSGGIRVALPDLRDAESGTVMLTISSCATIVQRYVIELKPQNSNSARLLLHHAIEPRWERLGPPTSADGAARTDYAAKNGVRISLVEQHQSGVTTLTATHSQ